MTFPIQFELFGTHYYWHYFFETAAFIIGVRAYYFLKRGINDPISDTNRLVIMFGAMFGALLGSRLLAMFEIPAEISHQTFLSFYQNKTVAGGFIGGLFGVELFKKIVGVKISSGDIYVFPIIIALFIGRIGCFSMGIAEPAYGIETHFLMGMDLGDGLKRHPVALYEMFWLVLMFLFFYFIRKKTLENGDRFKMFMLLYFLYRFFVEFIKPYHPIFLDLSAIQWSAVFIFGYYYRFLLRIFKRN